MKAQTQEGAPRARLLFYEVSHPTESWAKAFAEICPELEFCTYPDWPETPDDLPTFALVWNPEPGLLARYPNVRAVFSLGAGVDHLTKDPELPDVPVIRMSDDGLKADMADYILMCTMMLHRAVPTFIRQQRERTFKRVFTAEPKDVTVCILGFGALGQAAAAPLLRQGYRVSGWSRSVKKALSTDIDLYAGPDGLKSAIGPADILVSLLPETPDTKDLINSAFLKTCKSGVKIVNAGRGGVINDQDLINALDTGQVESVILDVFKTEPLPADDPYWSHPGVIVTPHVAAITRPLSAANYVWEGIQVFLEGGQPSAILDTSRGY